MKKSAILVSAFLLCGFVLSAGEAFGQASAGLLPDPDALYSQGVSLFYNGNYSEAERLLQQAWDQERDNPAYLYFIGLCRLRQGDEHEAQIWFVQGAEAELTPQGRLIDVPGHLRRIQGNERLSIEKTRSLVFKAYQSKEFQRQLQIYGDDVQRQRRALNDILAHRMDAGQNVASSDTLPSVAPINPLVNPEVDGYLSAELAAAGEGIFTPWNEFETDENGNVRKDERGNPIRKKYRSSAEQRRAADREQMKKEREEARKNFVDVFDSDEEEDDGTTFDGSAPVDPDTEASSDESKTKDPAESAEKPSEKTEPESADEAEE